jgi:hypothetical protein
VITRPRRARALESPKVADRFDDDDRSGVSPLVRTDRARIAGIKIAAGRADDDTFFRDSHRFGKGSKQRLALADQVECGSASRPGTKARQTRQELNETLDFRAGDV